MLSSAQLQSILIVRQTVLSAGHLLQRVRKKIREVFLKGGAKMDFSASK